MNKKDTDIQDIYRVEESAPEPASAPRSYSAEMIEQEIRRRLIFNTLVGLLSILLAGFITVSLIQDILPPEQPVMPTVKSTAFYTAYAPPEEEQWALEYRQVAYQADSSEPPGLKAFSTKWVKNAAYHTIMGEQALRMDALPLAQDQLETAIATFPSMTGVHHNLGMIYLKRQYFEKAVEQLQKALEEEPSIDVLNNLGAAYLGIKKYDRAEEFLQRAVQQQPDIPGCYKNLALLYQITGRTNEAVAAFEKYFQFNPNDSQLLETYTTYLAGIGQVSHMIDFLDRLESADTLAVRLLQAKAAAQNNDAESAVRALREVSKFISPRQIIVKMHEASFEKIAQTEPFEKFMYQLELATVSLSTNLAEKGETL